ncbi:PLC-like phosphodiesterase [Peziza echinospora]|nr:PLC-like phosphodiesterase [Peziza echinospora]
MLFPTLPSAAALVTMLLLSTQSTTASVPPPSRTPGTAASISISSISLNRRQTRVLSPSTRYSEQLFIGTHHSAMLRTQANGFNLSGNQFHNITVQLNAGIRMIHGQLHLPAGTTTTTGGGGGTGTARGANRGGELRICHASCALLDAGLLVSQLTEIARWLAVNKGEVVTMLWATPRGGSVTLADIAAAYTNSTLDLLSYTPPHKEMRVQDWPSVEEMVLAGRRVVTFLDTGANIPAAQQENATYLLPASSFVVQTPPETTKPAEFGCGLGGSGAAAAAGQKLVLVNHLLYEEQVRRGGSGRYPNVTAVGETNSGKTLGLNNVGSLLGHVSRCQKELFAAAAPTRKPNFAMVNFFDRGEVFAVQDVINGITASPVDLGLPVTTTGGTNQQATAPDGAGAVGVEKFITLDQLTLERTKEKEREAFEKEVEAGRGGVVAIGGTGVGGAAGSDNLQGVFTFTRTSPPQIRETEGVVNAGAKEFGSGASSLWRRGRGEGESGRGIVMGAVVGAAVAVGCLLV